MLATAPKPAGEKIGSANNNCTLLAPVPIRMPARTDYEYSHDILSKP